MTDASTIRSALSPTSKLVALSRDLVGVVESCLEPHDLGLDHWLALDALAAADGGTTMAELQGRIRTAAPTLTRVVDKLVTRAAVYREVDAIDRRKVRVHLSKRGAALHTDIAAAVTIAEHRWFDAHVRDVIAVTAQYRG